MNNKLWTKADIQQLFDQPFITLIIQAHNIHKTHYDVNTIELCSLLSVKTGACPEDCAYCPQSGHYRTDTSNEKLLSVEQVTQMAKVAKDNGAKRFCLGAAWRSPPKNAMETIKKYIGAIKAVGLESCVTLGMLTDDQAKELKAAGLDYYNHNLDTSPEYYKKIISTRTYQDRLSTLANVSNADIKVCCGGIIGMGETKDDRIEFLRQLTLLPTAPTSIPINRLIPIKGTPLENTAKIDNFEFIKTIAVARILIPQAVIRLAAGRETMSEEMQTLCFIAGANSIFYGDKLLTAGNPAIQQDLSFLEKLTINRTTDVA